MAFNWNAYRRSKWTGGSQGAQQGQKALPAHATGGVQQKPVPSPAEVGIGPGTGGPISTAKPVQAGAGGQVPIGGKLPVSTAAPAAPTGQAQQIGGPASAPVSTAMPVQAGGGATPLKMPGSVVDADPTSAPSQADIRSRLLQIQQRLGGGGQATPGLQPMGLPQPAPLGPPGGAPTPGSVGPGLEQRMPFRMDALRGGVKEMLDQGRGGGGMISKLMPGSEEGGPEGIPGKPMLTNQGSGALSEMKPGAMEMTPRRQEIFDRLSRMQGNNPSEFARRFRARFANRPEAVPAMQQLMRMRMGGLRTPYMQGLDLNTGDPSTWQSAVPR